jgi:hypothetical protein
LCAAGRILAISFDGSRHSRLQEPTYFTPGLRDLATIRLVVSAVNKPVHLSMVKLIYAIWLVL